MPATRAIFYPCRCLCFGLAQITRTRPLRRTIWHFSQILLTDGLTFMALMLAVNDPALRQVVWAPLDDHLVAREDLDEVHPHLSRDDGEHRVVRVLHESDAKHRVRERLLHDGFHTNRSEEHTSELQSHSF